MSDRIVLALEKQISNHKLLFEKSPGLRGSLTDPIFADPVQAILSLSINMRRVSWHSFPQAHEDAAITLFWIPAYRETIVLLVSFTSKGWPFPALFLPSSPSPITRC